ncbi:MAG: DNA polymerase I [Deltaproteobacteria bacterium]|nr:DNA polymerase I [Deltaproteobacteria bacterium]
MPTTLPPPGDPKALYVLDLSGYVFRAYHAVAPLSNSKGEPTFATLGVTNMLHALVRNQRPHLLAVAMDSVRPTFRHELYTEYKANRPPPPPDLAVQMARCRQVAEAYAIPVLQCEGVEADDLLATCVAEARKRGLFTVICSGDKDLLQLVDDDVIMWDAMRSRIFGAAEVKEKWGVAPNRVRDLLALMGDSSDNVPGVAHVGEKTAVKLLTEFDTLDGVYQNLDKVKGKTREYLKLHEADARLSQQLVSLKSDVPMHFDVEKLVYGGYERATVRALFEDLEFTRLVAAIDAEDAKATATGSEAAAPAGPAVYEAVLTTEALDEVIAQCRATGWFSVDTETTSLNTSVAVLVGISLSWKPGLGVYIPIGHRVLGDPTQLDRKLVLDKLRPLFADASVKKVGQNIKYDDIVLRRAGVPVRGYDFDTMLASYLIDPERHTHKLDEISKSELGYEMVSYESVTKVGKGKQITFDEVDIARATRYAAEDAEVVSRLQERLRPKLDSEALTGLLRDVEIPLALLLGRIEEHGVLVDADHLKAMSKVAGAEVVKLEAEAHALVGHPFNVNSPKQLETILFDELKLPVVKKTKTGRSTDAEVLEELASQHPLPHKILEVRGLTKLIGTYLDALPLMIDATGRVHSSFNQAVAATGRLSSADPNLQNIPIRTPLGREIRRAFVAPEGCLILSADYSQIELRVLAHLSGDPILVDAFKSGDDVHIRTAMEIFKVARDDVSKEMRAKAKTTNFAVIYGQGESSLGKKLGITRDEAAEFIEKYFQTFATLRKYLDDVVAKARTGEGVRTLLGRRRFLPDLHSSNRALRLTAERVAQNTPIQGTAADIIKLAMLRVDERLTAEKLATKMVSTVHDELVFEVPEGEKERVGPMVKETMEGVMKLEVPLVVECGWGKNWGDAH